MTLIHSLRIRNEAPILVGHLYEAFAHLVISEGGCFRARLAENLGICFELQLEKKTLVHLRKKEDIKGVAKNEYGQGHNTFPVFDGITTNPCRLFNMKVTENEEQGINSHTLQDAFNYMKIIPQPCEYYWVVPSDKFKTFNKHTPTTLIKQFVVEVPI